MKILLNSFVRREIVSFLTGFAMLVSLNAESLKGEAWYRPAESNVAAKYWVKVAASENEMDARLAVDGDEGTLWSANSGETWLSVDLVGTYDALRKVEIVFEGVGSAYKYVLEGSTNGGIGSSWRIGGRMKSWPRGSRICSLRWGFGI